MTNREMLIASIQLSDIPEIHKLYGQLKAYCPMGRNCDSNDDNCCECESEWLDLEHEKEG